MTAPRRVLAAVAWAALLMPGVTPAQSLDYAGLESLFGEPVTTSVTGSPQRLRDVPASMLIITAEDIRRSAARDLPGLLSHLAGIDVNRTSAEHADVAVRGYNSAFTPRLLVLVNGRQVYADYYGFTPWSTIPVELDSIRQIEVVKGPNGALFGFNAVGGVVNIVTYDPRGEDGAPTVALRAGMQDLEEVSATTSFRFGERSGLSVLIGTRRSDPFSTPREPADFAAERSNSRDILATDAHFALTPRVGFGVEATMSHVDQIEFPPTYTMSLTQYETGSLRTHWQAETDLGVVTADLYRNWIEADAFLAGSADPIRQFDNDVLIAELEDVFKVGTRHVVRIAGEYRDNSMQTTPIGGASVHYEVLALTAMSEWSVKPAVSWSNAIRVDDWQLGRTGFLPPEYVTDFGLTNAIWDISRDEISFNTGLVWAISDTASLKFMAGRARELPNLLNLGGDFSESFGVYFLGFPTLEPTNVSNYEVLWQHDLSESEVGIDVGYFRGTTTDVQSTFFGNLGDSETRGLEARVKGRLFDRWGWDVSMMEQRVHDDFDRTFPAEVTYVEFERTTPERTGKAHLGWTYDSIELDIFVRHESTHLGLRGPNPGDFSASFTEIPSYYALDARLGFSLGEHCNLSITGRNLTQSEQRQTSAPEVERQIFATFKYQF